MHKITIYILFLLLPVISIGQPIRAYHSESEGSCPVLYWTAKGMNDTMSFTVYRAHIGDKEFTPVQTLKFARMQHDTAFFTVYDTTLGSKGIYQYYLAFVRGTDTTFSEALYAHNMGYIAPPSVVSFTASPVKDRKAIRLEWKLNYTTTVQSLALFRSRDFEEGYELVANLPANATSYTDLVTRSNEPWFYFLQVRDYFGYQLPSVRIHGFSTYAEKPYPPQDLMATPEGKNVKLSWRGVGDNILYYRVYRRLNHEGSFIPLAFTILPVAEEVTYIDSGMVNPGLPTLEYYAVSVSDGYLESNPGDTVMLSFPVSVEVNPPEEAEYRIDDEGMVNLFWKSQSDDPNVSGYNVYRKDPDGKHIPLNHEPLHYSQNFYADSSLKAFGVYIYSIESISKSGKNSSARTDITVEYDAPKINLLLSSTQNSSGITLNWKPLAFRGIKTLYLYRQKEDGPMELISKISNEKGTYTDKQVVGGTTYIYSVVAEFTSKSRITVNDGLLVRRVVTK